MERRNFAIIGHRAINSGKLQLNDLPGIGGRMDVLLRAVNSALFLSHGIRKNVCIILHLMGGPGPPRRIMFDGAKLRGLHTDERAIAGKVAKVISEPVPPIGIFSYFGEGISHSGGDISTTISEWKKNGSKIIRLSADSEPFEKYIENCDMEQEISFILSDDADFSPEEYAIMQEIHSYSIGKKWLQGHSAITIVHHILDQKFYSDSAD